MAQFSASSSLFIVLAAILGLASILAVLLRMLARRRSKAHLGFDDVFAVIALCGYLAFLGIVIWESYNGLHYDFQNLPPKVLKNNLKAIYISDVFAPVPGAAGRFSLLLLYNRVFKTDRSFHIAVRILAIINGLWYIGCEVALLLQCNPPKKTWNPSTKGQCINTVAFVIAAEIPEILLDFSMMILPISVLRRLQLSMRRKINLALIFAVGGFVGIIGFLRIAITYRPARVSTYETEIWLCIQLGCSVICCCLPTYGPILPKDSIFPAPSSLYSKLMSKIRIATASRSTSERESKSGKKSEQMSPSECYENLSDRGSERVLTQAAGDFYSAEQYIAGRDFPMNAISVKSTVEMV